MLNSNFDIDAYLSSKLDAENKLASLADASQQKQADLLAMRQREEAKKALEATWVGKLGLTPGDFTANSVNKVASFASGATRLVGQVASLPTNIASKFLTEQALPTEVDAYNRLLVGNEQPGDAQLLSRPASMGGATIKDALISADARRRSGREINDATNFESIVEQSNRDSLNKDIQQGFDGNWAKVKTGSKMDAVSGLASILATAGSAILSNPNGVLEQIAENIPQLFIGAIGKVGEGAMLASNVGYGVDYYQQYLEHYAKENGGQLPPENLRSEAEWKAASLVFAEHAGDKLGLAFSGVGSKPATDAVRTSFKQSLKNTTKAGAEGFTSEALTEGYQTGIENSLTGDPTDAKTIFTGAMIGGASGAGLSGGGRAVSEALKATPEHVTEREQALDKVTTRMAAINSGDVSAYTDPASKSFAPETAIATLFGNNQKPETTPEQRQANIDKADQIIESIKTEHAQAQTALDLTTVAGTKKKIAEYQDFITAAPDSPNAAAAKSAITVLQEQLGVLQANGEKPSAVKAAQAKFKQLDARLTEANKNRQQLDLLASEHETQAQLGLANITDEQIAEHITNISQPVDPTESKDALAAEVSRSETSAVSVINLAMSAPERLNPKDIAALVADETNALTPPQRSYLSAFVRAQESDPTLRQSHVAADIYRGEYGNKGVVQYRQGMAKAVATGKQATAQKELEGIDKFALAHQAKAAAANAAIALGLGTPILKVDGEWVAGTKGQKLTAEDKKAGGRTINSGKLVLAIGAEAKALQNVAAELQAAYNLKFTPSVTKGLPNVQNVSQGQVQPGLVLQPTVQSTAEPVAKPAGSVTAPASDGTTDVKPTAVVGTPVVEKAAVVSEPKQPVALEPSAPVATKEVAPITATQAQYDEALRVKDHGTENDYATVPGDIAALITAMNNEEKIQITDKTANTEEAPASSVKSENTQDTESTAKTAETPTEVDSTAKQTAPQTQAASVEPGLTIFKESTAAQQLPPGIKLGAVYRTINKAVAFLTQKHTEVKSDKDITKDLPLVSISNLLERWTKGEISHKDAFIGELNEVESNALATFKTIANKWASVAKAGFIKGSLNEKQRADFLYEDPIQDFMNKDGMVDSNIVTAVVYAGYTWLTETANRPALLDDDAILGMHGQPTDGSVTVRRGEGKQLLRSMATLEDIAINSIGKHVVSALGLKANANAPQDYLAKVIAGFGVHGLLMLEKQGLINRGSLTFQEVTAVMPEMFSGTQEELAKKTHITYSYIQLPRGEKLVLVGDTKTIRESAVGSQGVLDRFFGSERSPKEASWTPIPFRQATAKGTGQTISKKQTRILEAAQKVPTRIIPDMWNALTVLGDAVILRAAGWKELDNTKIQKTNYDAVETQNVNLENQLNLMKELVQGAIDTSPEKIKQAFFGNNEVWRNFRVGVTTGNMNLQSSKIHRFMFGRDGWESTFRMDDEQGLKNFQVAVAQALGIKIDQQSNDTTLEKMSARLLEKGNRTIELAILLNKSIAEPTKSILSERDKEDIGELAAKAEGMQTLQALVSYGKYLAALSSGAEEFTTTMLVGVDGKTNGPIFSMLALGAAKTSDALYKFVNKGGFYKATDGINNFSQWYQKGTNQDLYEGLAQHLLAMLPSGMDAALTSFQTITKELLNKGKATSAGRGIVKTPLTSFAFGSSTTKSAENMKDAFLKAVTDRIEAVANSEAKGVTTESLVNSINELLRLGNATPKELLAANTSIETLMELELSPKQEQALGAAFNDILGDKVDGGMREYFPDFITRRNSVNSSIQASFAIYSAIYQDLRNTELNRQMDAGEMAFKVETVKATKDTQAHQQRIPLHDMTIGQEKALRERVASVLPRTNTTFTVGSDDLGSGIYMAKMGTGISQSPMYQIKVQLGEHLTDNGKPVITPKGNKVSHLLTKGMEKQEQSPGVAGLPYMMHSFDAGVMMESLNDSKEDTKDSHSIAALNVHDERAEGAHRVNESARAINKSTWTNMLRFSPATEAYQLLERSIINAVNMINAGDVSNTALKGIQAALISKLPFKMRLTTKSENLAWTLLNIANQAQVDANTVRLQALSEMVVIDQYTWEGGEYHVTDTDRAEAKAELEVLVKEMSAETKAAANALGKFMRDGIKTAQAPKVDGVVIEQSSKEEETRPKDPVTSPFGELGAPAVESDQALVSFFTKNPKATAQRVAEELIRRYHSDTTLPNQVFNLKILQMVRKLVDPKMPVEYITKDSKATDVLGKPENNSRGWFSVFGGQDAIYVVGPDFKHANLTPEVLVHELVHAALTRTLENGTAGVKTYINELMDLRSLALAYAEKQGLTAKYKDALTVNFKPGDTSPVHEFITWGMTNEGFQKEILSQISMESTTRSKLGNALQAFIDTLSRVLGLNDAGGMKTLITNVSGLFAEAVKSVNPTGSSQGIVQTVTAAFKKWFGDSKVVDVHGNPLVVYHGSAVGGIEVSDGRASFFSSSPQVADSYADNAPTDVHPGKLESRVTQSVYLKISNPLVLDGAGAAWYDISYKGKPISTDNLINEARKLGHDGIIVRNMYDDISYKSTAASDIFITIGGTGQIKSAIGNNGQFDAKNPLILAMAAQQQEIDAVHAYTTLDLHEALANTTRPLAPAFENHLRGLLGGIVDKLHGPFGAFKEAMRKNEASSPMGVWLKALHTGQAPFASSIIASGLNGSAQEDFAIEQVEATVRAALNNNEAQGKEAYKALSDLYTETYKRLKPSDFRSQAEYDFVFKIEKSNGNTSDYLSRFAALGLASEHFNGLLKVATDRSTKSMTAGMSFAERLQTIFENILELFHGKLSNTYKGQPADQKLRTLVEQLVDVEAKHRTVLVKNALDSMLLAPVEQATQKATQAVKDKIAAVAGSQMFMGSKNAIVKAAGNMVKISSSGRVDQFIDVLRTLQDKYSKERLSVVGSLLQEYKGHNIALQTLLRMRKDHEGLRKDTITGLAKTAMTAFANNGKDLDQLARTSITPVFMRTGAHNLLGDFSMAQIEDMMANPAALKAAIATHEAKLNGIVPAGLKADYIDKANALAMFRATGENRADNHLLKNATSIAHMYGTVYAKKISAQQASNATPILTKLISLYALEYSGATNPEGFKAARETLHAENLRGGENGIEFVLKLHQRLEQESLERVFKNNPVLMLHGYTPEIYDPYVTLKVANAIDGAELEKEGYSVGVPLALDPADPDQDPQRLYALNGVGMVRRVTGALSYTGKKAMGSEVHNGYRNTNTVAGLANSVTNANIAANRAASIDPRRNPNRARADLTQVKQASFMAPVLDEHGNVTTWSYLMTAATKDDLLRRDNRFDKILGKLAGSIYDKESSIEDNLKAVEALKEQYDEDYAKHSESYVLIGQKSDDPENRALWDLLPYETQEAIKSSWGMPGMWVRKDNVDIVFGYRKLSITTMFEKDPKARKNYEKLVIQLAEFLFGRKAALRLAQGERAWQDLVAEAKDDIVIKTGLVMMNNIRSNLWLLVMSGVPLRDVLHHHLVALKGAMSWNKDNQELAHLKALRDSGHTLGKAAEIDRNILRLEDALARNPVREQMEAGLMPTIVDDVSADDDIYSYKSELARKMDRFVDKLNPTVVKVGKIMYMSHDTGLYKGFHRITQLSDFIARYTLYQHLTTRQDTPLDKATAVQKASDAFVNYDIPMHRGLQYMDDMGLFMFTKYFIRIQKVLAETTKENPGRVLASLALAHYLSLGPTVLDESSMWMHIGRNPFHSGPMKFMMTLDDILPIKAMMSILSPGAAAAPVVHAASAAVGL